MEIEQHQTIRTVRLILTCLLLFLATWYYQVPERIWSLITVWFVMTEYTSLGGVFRKCFYRFSGTFLSAVYGIGIIYFFANNVIINMIAFVVGVFVYMYYFLDGDKMYIATIGSVTLSIVLLNHNDLDAAILRTFNIIIGILASMFMIRFFYPKYARDEVIETQVYLIKQLENILKTYLDKSKSLATVQTEYLMIEGKLLTGLSSFSRHLSEAKIETGNTTRFITCNVAAIGHIRHLFRLLSVFVSYLTTDDIRSDVGVDNQLNQLLLDLHAIQSHLEHNRIEVDQPDRPAETLIEVAQTSQSLQLILTTMNKEVNQLAKAMSEVCQYDRKK